MNEDLINRLTALLKSNRPKIEANNKGFKVNGVQYIIPKGNTKKHNTPNVFR
jgi:hypothetical protein